MNWTERLAIGLAGSRPMPSKLYPAFRRTEAQLLNAIDYWAHTLGYPGGIEECGRCRRRTHWGVCLQCQPTEFARLP